MSPPTLNLWANVYIDYWEKYVYDLPKDSILFTMQSSVYSYIFKKLYEESYSLIRHLFFYLDLMVLYA